MPDDEQFRTLVTLIDNLAVSTQRGLDSQAAEMRTGFTALDTKLNSLETETRAGFARVDRRLGNLETRVEGLETSMVRLETSVGRLETRVERVETHVESIDKEFRGFRRTTDRRVTALEIRNPKHG